MPDPITPSPLSTISQKFPQPQIPNENIEPVKEEGYSDVDDLKNVNDSEVFDDMQYFLEFLGCQCRDCSVKSLSQKVFYVILRALAVSSILPNTFISPDSGNYKTLFENDKKRIKDLSENMESILDLNIKLNLVHKSDVDEAKIYINNNRFALLESEYKYKYNRIKDLREIINDNLNFFLGMALEAAKEKPFDKDLEKLQKIINKSLESHENIFSIIFFYFIDSIKLLLKKIASIFITPNEKDQLIDLLSSKIKTALQMGPYRAVPLETAAERFYNRRHQESSATVDPNALSIIPEPELV